VAAELFAHQGFHKTTTRQIAERAGINEAILFRHFPHKASLYWPVIDEKCRETPARKLLAAQLALAEDEKTIFTEVAAALLEQNMADTTLMRLLLFGTLEEHELTARLVQAYVTSFCDLLAEYIRKRIRAQVFRPVDATVAAQSFLGMVFSYLLEQKLFCAARHQKSGICKVSEMLADIWVEGMRAHPT
jgi:AcrR family transcriptional regulator